MTDYRKQQQIVVRNDERSMYGKGKHKRKETMIDCTAKKEERKTEGKDRCVREGKIKKEWKQRRKKSC